MPHGKPWGTACIVGSVPRNGGMPAADFVEKLRTVLHRTRKQIFKICHKQAYLIKRNTPIQAPQINMYQFRAPLARNFIFYSASETVLVLLPTVARRTNSTAMVITMPIGRQIHAFWIKPAMMKFTKLISATVIA